MVCLLLFLPPICVPEGMSTHDFQSELVERGYVVVPTPLDPSKNPPRLVETVAAFDTHFTTSPEFICGNVGDVDFMAVLGGFAACGNPSSFHDPFVRLMREQLHALILEEDVLPLRGRKCEKTFDRITLRRKGQTPTADPMHRDNAPNALGGDDVFGGWLNLDSTDQHFLCAPKTHTETVENFGFATIKDKSELERLRPLFTTVAIPPGHCLVFYERLVHRVAPTKAKHTMRRMHVGWRVTDSNEPLFGSEQTRAWVEDQAVPKIKSGQCPRVWPSCYGNYPKHFAQLSVWSKRTFAPECLVEHTIKQGTCKGMTFVRVNHQMKSLRAYGLPMHRGYDEPEKALLFPNRELYLRSFDHPNKRKRYLLPTEDEWHTYTCSNENVSGGKLARRPRPEMTVWEHDE